MHSSTETTWFLRPLVAHHHSTSLPFYFPHFKQLPPRGKPGKMIGFERKKPRGQVAESQKRPPGSGGGGRSKGRSSFSEEAIALGVMQGVRLEQCQLSVPFYRSLSWPPFCIHTLAQSRVPKDKRNLKEFSTLEGKFNLFPSKALLSRIWLYLQGNKPRTRTALAQSLGLIKVGGCARGDPLHASLSQGGKVLRCIPCSTQGEYSVTAK